MGIKDFSRLLDRYAGNCAQPVSIRDCRKKTWAIDANIYMYRFMGAKPFTPTRHLDRFTNFVQWMKKHNIEPIFVFDGESPEEKKQELKLRRENKNQATSHLKDLQQGVSVLHHLEWRWIQLEKLFKTISFVDESILNVEKVFHHEKKYNVPLSGLYEIVGELLEWGTETNLPNEIIQSLFEKSLVTHENFPISAIPFIVRFVAQLRLRKHTPHMVEIDWMHDLDHLQSDLESCVLQTPHVDDIPKKNCATTMSCQSMTLETLESLINDSLLDRCQDTKNVFVPFLVCIHCTKSVSEQLMPLVLRYQSKVDESWASFRKKTFLVALVIQHSAFEKGEWLFPSEKNAQDFFTKWQSEIWWPTKDQEKAAVGANFNYYEWICSDRSSEWWFALKNHAKMASDLFFPFKEEINRLHVRRPCLYDGDLYSCGASTLRNMSADISRKKAAELLEKTAYEPRDPLHRPPKVVPEKQTLECLANYKSIKENPYFIEQMNDRIQTLEPQVTRVTSAQVEEVKEVLRNVLHCRVIVAEHEAEATCGRIVRAGMADWVVTEDYDAMPFGTPFMLKNLAWKSIVLNDVSKDVKTMDHYIIGELVSFECLLRTLDLSPKEFVDLCILMGSDFCESIKEMNVTKAWDLIRKHRSLEQIVMMNNPNSRHGLCMQHYSIENAVKARNLFLNNHSSTLPEIVKKQFLR